MTPTTTPAQPEALRLAERLDLYASGDDHQRDIEEAAAQLRALHAQVAALTAAPGVQAQQVWAYAVQANIDGKWCTQWPVALSQADAERDMLMYTKEDQKRMRVLPLIAAPAQPAEGAAYAEAPIPYGVSDYGYNVFRMKQMLDFADATHALRASHGQAPAYQQAGAEALVLLRDMRNWYRDHQAIHYQPLLDKVDAVLGYAPKPTPTAQPAPAARVIIDFSQVGTAGPFPVVDGRVALPDNTMQDLVRMLRPSIEAPAAGAVAGWQLVPKTLDANMHAAMDRAFTDAMHLGTPVSPDAWEAALAAAPTPAAQGGDADRDREDLMHCFWVAMGACETAADNDNDPVLRVQVEGFYRLWNRLNAQELQPAWVRRAALAQKEGTHGN